MQIDTESGLVRIVNEPAYSFGSQDNVRSYPLEVRLSNGSLTSIHAVEINGLGVVVVGAGGGCSAVHEHSAVAIKDRLYLAVGDHVVCLSLGSPHRLFWATQVDIATCFGIHWEDKRAALISHGELEIVRLTMQGDVIWSASGADVFSEGFSLLSDCIEVLDFNRTIYRLNYATGEAAIPIEAHEAPEEGRRSRQ